MKNVKVCIVDYGLGNHASVMQCIRGLGFRVRTSAEYSVLDEADILILPGVGAFPSAMEALHKQGLVNYLKKKAREHHPIIGICLGMQLLASFSPEIRYTEGLDLIPGEIVALTEQKWHIGWNTLECVDSSSLFQASDGELFYFNHSFQYRGLNEYQICLSHDSNSLVSAIQRGNVIGVQFHPEKSQKAGRVLLNNLILGLVHD